MSNTKKSMLLSMTNGTMLKHFSQEDAIDVMREAGFDAIDYSFHSDEQTYSPDRNPEEFVRIRKLAEDKGMVFNQAHAPFRHPMEDAEMDKYVADIVQCIKNSSLLGVKTLVTHPIKFLPGDQSNFIEKRFEANMKFYRRLKPYCEEYGVNIALENMWHLKRYPGGDVAIHSVCSKPEEFIRYLDELNSDCFVGCLDIGHAMLVREDPADFIRALGNKRLKALHVHDVDGVKDTHTIPYYGGMGDWDSIAQALKDINYDGDFTYEAGMFMAPLPVELFPIGLKMMAEVGKHIIKKITD